MDREIILTMLDRAAALFCDREAELGRLDAAAGDGDHGAGMMRGWTAAAQAAHEAPADTAAGALLVTAGGALADAAGGASGALFGAWLTAIGTSLGQAAATPAPEGADPVTVQVAAALVAGLGMVQRLGKAAVGDKTLVDALEPFVLALGEGTQAGLALPPAWHNALFAAQAGAAATAHMVAKRGRSARLGERSLGHVDPGAQSMVYVLEAADAVLQARCR